MKFKRTAAQGVVAILLMQGASAQEAKQQVPGLNDFSTPGLKAELAVGFNYDYLRSPLRVDYDRAQGLFGINIPISIKPSAETVSELMGNVADNFTDGDYFAPSVAVKQFANTTLQVDVPFYGGVLEWSHMRMMNVKYKNLLGIPNFAFQPDSLPGNDNLDISLLLRGNMSVPIGFDLGWESMTFGYAYKFNDMFQVALNLHRHYFYVDLLGDANIDILGNIDVTASTDAGSTTIPLDPDYSLHNQFGGFYDLKKWTPTIAGSVNPTVGKWKTGFQFLGRFGFTDYAKGSLNGGYAVPFFVDPQSFKVSDSLTNPEYIASHMEEFNKNSVVGIDFETSNDLLWAMPSAFTFGWDISRDKLNLSYTKFAGDVRMELVDNDFQKGDAPDQKLDTLDLRMAAHVDHMIVLQGHFPWIFFNFGIFSFDVDFGDKMNIISEAASNTKGMIPYGEGIMVPIASGGIILGDKMQFKVEGHLAPFPALNTGIIYHF